MGINVMNIANITHPTPDIGCLSACLHSAFTNKRQNLYCSYYYSFGLCWKRKYQDNMFSRPFTYEY